MQAIERYMNEVKKELYKLTPADDFLHELESNLIEYSEDHPDCTIEDLIEQFGRPEDLAKEFLDSSPAYSPKEVAKKSRKTGIIIALLCVLLLAVVIYCIAITAKSESEATQFITIYEDEAVDEGE